MTKRKLNNGRIGIYPGESAGAVMERNFITLRKGMRREDCFGAVRCQAPVTNMIEMGYILDAAGQLLGSIALSRMLVFEGSVEQHMEHSLIHAHVMEDREQAALRLKRYRLPALPVLDDGGCMVGILTRDQAIGILERETTEDMEKMAATMPTEQDYFHTGIWETWRSRIPWLLLLMLSATVTGTIISGYETALSSCMILTAFIAMLSDTGGNSGSQTTAEVIRAISLGEIGAMDRKRVLWKEIKVALACGITLALVNFCKLMLVDRLLLGNPSVTPGVAGVVSLTLIAVVLMAKCLGAMFPLCADAVGIDPAMMAGPLVTTVVDGLSLLIYFNIAKGVLGI